MTLSVLFDKIRQPIENDSFQFSAVAIPEYPNHRIAKDKSGNPTLLLSNSNQVTKTITSNLKLQNVSVLFDANCRIQQNGILIEKCFTAVCYTGNDITLKKYFLKLCSTLVEDLGDKPAHEDIRREITRFIELLKLAIQPQTKTIQGLWAELFLISESKEPLNLIRYWHCIPEEKFDFNNGEERLEVKSSSDGTRVHNFSVEQLYSPSDTHTLIASLFVRQSSTGKSIDELATHISSHLANNIQLIEKLQMQIALTLGVAILNSSDIRFDYELAKDSLRFYRVEDIPKISFETIPSFVSNVTFKSNISGVEPVSNVQLGECGGLFNSL